MIIVIIIYIYSIFPLFLTSKKYYKIIGSFNYVTEFNILKKMTFVGFTFILILLAYILISNFILDINVITFLISLLKVLFTLTLIDISGILLRILLQFSKRDFRFYYAKGYIKKLSQNVDECDKVDYFRKAINSYDHYLQRSLKLKINNCNLVFYKIVNESSINKNKVIESFDYEDKLQPIKEIIKILNIEKIDEFLIQKSLWDIVKEMSIFITGIVPVVISILSAYIDLFP